MNKKTSRNYYQTVVVIVAELKFHKPLVSCSTIRIPLPGVGLPLITRLCSWLVKPVPSTSCLSLLLYVQWFLPSFILNIFNPCVGSREILSERIKVGCPSGHHHWLFWDSNPRITFRHSLHIFSPLSLAALTSTFIHHLPSCLSPLLYV